MNGIQLITRAVEKGQPANDTVIYFLFDSNTCYFSHVIIVLHNQYLHTVLHGSALYVDTGSVHFKRRE